MNNPTIVFTGHRNCITETSFLQSILEKYPSATLIHGGAIGFDTQVDSFARANGIEPIVVRPNYKKYPPKIAPIIRNHEMVDRANIVVACWDGRERGGTFDTIQYAKSKGFQIDQQIILAPCLGG